MSTGNLTIIVYRSDCLPITILFVSKQCRIRPDFSFTGLLHLYNLDEQVYLCLKPYA